MNGEEWTKGPWIIEFCNCDEEGVLEEAEFTGAIMDQEGRDIAHVYNESNAKLIAAAPVMYEALLKCVSADPTIVTNRPGWMDYVASIEGARAALKKARGEQ